MKKYGYGNQYITVTQDVDIDIDIDDVLDEISTENLINYLQDRSDFDNIKLNIGENESKTTIANNLIYFLKQYYTIYTRNDVYDAINDILSMASLPI